MKQPPWPTGDHHYREFLPAGSGAACCPRGTAKQSSAALVAAAALQGPFGRTMTASSSAEPNTASMPQYPATFPLPQNLQKNHYCHFPAPVPLALRQTQGISFAPLIYQQFYTHARKFAFLLAADTKGLKLFWDMKRTFLQSRQYIMLGCIEDAKIFCDSTKKWLTCLYIHSSHLCNIPLISHYLKSFRLLPLLPQEAVQKFWI